MTLYEMIYETMMGNICTEYQVPGVNVVFYDGSYCDKKYAEVADAYVRICDRLGVVDEDPDVETIINALNDIQDYVCRQMFFLGVQHEKLLLNLVDMKVD